RRRRAPLAEGLRGLAAIEGGVHLDRGEAAARIVELVLARQVLRVEGAAAPGREIPASDADPDQRAAPSRCRLRGPGLDALVLEEVLQLARLEHLADDVAAADELALDVELRNGRPAR